MENVLQRTRFELKYRIDERLASEIRAFAMPYLVEDPYARGSDDHAYDIFSIYLDSPRYDLFYATVHGLADRFKLRVRYYNEAPGRPTFFEIKRRKNEAILKDRARVRCEHAPRLMEGAAPERGMLLKPGDERDWRTLLRFCELRDQLHAGASCIVAYRREAWITPYDNTVRLTFDRGVRGAAYDPKATSWRGEEWVDARIGNVILELKFTDRYPNWMRELVHAFDLNRVPLAKYVNCVERLGWARKAADWVRPIGEFVRNCAPARTPTPATVAAVTTTAAARPVATGHEQQSVASIGMSVPLAHPA